jgi:hypothetical protein
MLKVPKEELFKFLCEAVGKEQATHLLGTASDAVLKFGGESAADIMRSEIAGQIGDRPLMTEAVKLLAVMAVACVPDDMFRAHEIAELCDDLDNTLVAGRATP